MIPSVDKADELAALGDVPLVACGCVGRPAAGSGWVAVPLAAVE